MEPAKRSVICDPEKAIARKKSQLRTMLISSSVQGMLTWLKPVKPKSKAPDSGTATPIQHVVVIFQENVSFDHYFGTYPMAMNTGAPGEPFFTADPGTPSVNNLLSAGLLTKNPNFVAPDGNPFRLTRAQAATCDQDHGYTDEQASFDLGLMDNFLHFNDGTCTGLVTGQPVPNAKGVRYEQIALGAGYPRAFAFEEVEAFEVTLPGILRAPGPVFVALKVLPEVENTPIGGRTKWNPRTRDQVIADLRGELGVAG